MLLRKKQMIVLMIPVHIFPSKPKLTLIVCLEGDFWIFSVSLFSAFHVFVEGQVTKETVTGRRKEKIEVFIVNSSQYVKGSS